MPLLIAALSVGLVVFHFKTKPEKAQPEPALIESPPLEAAGLIEKSIPRAIPVAMVEPAAQGPTLPLLDRDGVTVADFTPWMSPLALDTYIRQMNRGFEKTFWERGHWIKAVEGRWNNGSHEFRIVFAANPDPEKLQWYYRIDQTEAQFKETLSRLSSEGYTLAQSHAYDLPDGSKRFQGVWQRTVSGSATKTVTPDFIGAAAEVR